MWDTVDRFRFAFSIVINPGDPRIVYAAVGANGIIKSKDFGKTWARADSGMKIIGDGPIPVMLAIDPNHPDTLFAGTGGAFAGPNYRSTNGGTSWEVLAGTGRLANGATAVAVNPKSSLEVFVATTAGLLRSEDGGTSWSYLGFDTLEIRRIAFDPTGREVYLGVNDVKGFYRTIDHGQTWNAQIRGLPDAARTSDLVVSPDSLHPQAYIAVWNQDGYGVYRAGSDWIWHQISAAGMQVSCIALDDSVLFAGGYGVYSTKVVTSLPVGVRAPTAFDLFQNYPNPFNPSTAIRYALPQRTHVTLTVFNILGQHVATLVDAVGEAGFHEAGFDGSGLASGLYIYRLQAGDFVRCRKMALVK